MMGIKPSVFGFGSAVLATNSISSADLTIGLILGVLFS